MGFATMDLPIRVFVIIGLLLWCGVMLFKSWNRRELSEWSSWFFPGLIIIILIPTSFMELRWQTHEATGSQIVKEVSGNPDGYLHCQRLTEAFLDARNTAGEVWSNEPDRAIVKFGECQSLMGLQDRVIWGKPTPSVEEVTAVAILIHEAVHVGGNFNEAATECETKQQLAGILHEYYKLSKAEANEFSTIYREEISVRLPAKYQVAECTVQPLE